MALKITLKPNEKILIAGAAITNGRLPARLLVENTVPILREKDILKRESADSPARRIYFVVQLMYMDPDHLTAYHKLYWNLVRQFVKAAPSALGLIDTLSKQVLAARYYRALKLARKIIEYEQSILSKNKGVTAPAPESPTPPPVVNQEPVPVPSPYGAFQPMRDQPLFSGPEQCRG